MTRSTRYLVAGLPFALATLVETNTDQVWFYVLSACTLLYFATGFGLWIYDRE